MTAALPARRPSRTRAPSLRVERALQREGFGVVAGMDEVGRGALAGPVTVGVVLVDAASRSAPPGIRDSKLLSPERRQALVRPIRRWARTWGVGHAAPGEIDRVGILAALRIAGRRALAAAGTAPDLVVLDGNHDWLTDPAATGLLTELAEPAQTVPPVRTLVRGDLVCSSVAGASILAKVARDALMVGLAREHPAYGWDVNKGYAAPGHRAALRHLGASERHRRSWNLFAEVVGGGASMETTAMNEEVAAG